jgi:hypothetical protein
MYRKRGRSATQVARLAHEECDSLECLHERIKVKKAKKGMNTRKRNRRERKRKEKETFTQVVVPAEGKLRVSKKAVALHGVRDVFATYV